MEMLELNTKLNNDYIVSSCSQLTQYLFLESVNNSINLFSNWNKLNQFMVTNEDDSFWHTANTATVPTALYVHLKHSKLE